MFIECDDTSACSACASGSVYSVVVVVPSFVAVRCTLNAISPRFATRRFFIRAGVVGIVLVER